MTRRGIRTLSLLWPIFGINLTENLSMTAFTTGNIPSNVNTLEELAAWACSALAEINTDDQIVTGAGQLEQSVTAQTFRFAGQETSPERLVIVAYLPLTSDWRGQGKIWSNGISELSTDSLPAGYTSN